LSYSVCSFSPCTAAGVATGDFDGSGHDSIALVTTVSGQFSNYLSLWAYAASQDLGTLSQAIGNLPYAIDALGPTPGVPVLVAAPFLRGLADIETDQLAVVWQLYYPNSTASTFFSMFSLPSLTPLATGIQVDSNSYPNGPGLVSAAALWW